MAQEKGSQDLDEGWIGAQRTEVAQPSKMRQLLSDTFAPTVSAEAEWAKDWDEKKLTKLRIALQKKRPDEEVPSRLNETLLERAKAAYKEFTQYIPLLYLARQQEFESILTEIFSEAVQTTEEAQVGYLQVLIDLMDYRTTQYFLNRFHDRGVDGLEKISPFRKAVLQWLVVAKDKVHHEKATFPIQAAVRARRAEIATVENVAKVAQPPKEGSKRVLPLYTDDELVKVVKQVCSTSKTFAYSIFGIEFNSSGAFDDVRQDLIDINRRRKGGELKANAKILPPVSELGVYVKVLLIAYDKLTRALESSQVNLNVAHCDRLNEEISKNRAFEAALRAMAERLDRALADNAQISGMSTEIIQLKSDIQRLVKQNEKLRAELKEEKQQRQETEAQNETLVVQNRELSSQLKEEQTVRQSVEADNEKLRVELAAERESRQRVEEELRLLREERSASSTFGQRVQKDSFQKGATKAFFSPPKGSGQGASENLGVYSSPGLGASLGDSTDE